MTLMTSPTSVGSSADVGSSNSSTSGSMVSARAIATRCFWPPDRREGYSSRFSESPTFSRNFSAVAIAWSRGMPFTRVGPSMRLSMTRRCGNRLNSWKTIWAPSRIWRICSRWVRLRAFSGSASTRLPPTSTEPMVGSSRKLMHRSSVLLPDPDFPIRQMVSRG